MIRQPAEMVEKTRRLRNLRKSCPVEIHHRPPPATQWMTQIQHFSSLSRFSSPDYPAFRAALPCIAISVRSELASNDDFRRAGKSSKRIKISGRPRHEEPFSFRGRDRAG